MIGHLRPVVNTMWILFLLISLAAVSFALSVLRIASAQSATIAATTVPVYEITTRGNSTDPVLPGAIGVQGNGYNDKYPFGEIQQLFNDCPSEISIVIHGWNLTEMQAKERFDRVKMSIEHNQYSIPIVGYSWLSNVTWADAKSIANQNGPRLAHFIFDYKDACKHQHNKDVNIRLVAHSLGARVALNTLKSLNDINDWNTNHYNLTSVHLMGAAVDDELVSKNPSDTGDSFLDDGAVYGMYIQNKVVNFYNLYDPNDDLLKPPYVYSILEGDFALGYHGKQIGIDAPSVAIYKDINVEGEIPNIDDSDGDRKCDIPILNPFAPFSAEICTITAIGENHFGYFGFRSATDGTLIDDGAMNVVVINWRSP
jgi:pimeloyl-ACP methyl ester carboxylesterase